MPIKIISLLVLCLSATVYGWGVAGFGGTRNTGTDQNYYVSSLVAYWPLDETSGTRADSVGANDLVNSGADTGSYGTGKIGNAYEPAQDGSSYRATAAGLGTPSNNAAISFWVKIMSWPPMSSKTVAYNGSDSVFSYASGSGTTSVNTNLFCTDNLHFSSFSSEVWVHIVVITTASGSEVWKNGVKTALAGTFTSWSNAVFKLNQEHADNAILIDEIGIWHDAAWADGAAKQAWVDLLYNSGAGVRYSIIANRGLLLAETGDALLLENSNELRKD